MPATPIRSPIRTVIRSLLRSLTRSPISPLGLLLIFAVSTSGVSCDRGEFPLYAQLGDLRVLTIKAVSNAEVNPGATVTLQPVISDLNGGGRQLNVIVQTCVDPGLSLGAVPVCAAPDSTSNSSFSASTLGANNTYTGEAPPFTVNVPPLTLAAPTDRYNGVNYLVIYTVTSGDGASTVTSFKRILVSDPGKTGKNQNPAFSGVTSNGVSLTASSASASNVNPYSSAVATLQPSFSVGAEQYQWMNPDGTFIPRTELLATTWFYTDGSTQYQRTSDTDVNQWTPARVSTRGVALVAVVRDGRGGEDYQIFQFN
ncbi:MAG: hypothetical protein C5B49_09625 [Bdellovibrio sp.]|nr:MAG: hypothetical protein C5B49_09625 [Bdellovibrio sp.]